MLNQLIYPDIKEDSSGGGGTSSSYPDPPLGLPGYVPYQGYEYGGENEVVFLHGNSGRPICSSNTLGVFLEWRFYMGLNNIFPRAIVNGNEVCRQHNPSHVVSYIIEKPVGIETIKMSLRSSGRDCRWDGGQSCTYRATLRGTTITKGGTCGGGATFRVLIKANGEVSIS
jgi:hypothetical protein